MVSGVTSNFCQGSPSDGLASHGQSATLIIGQPESSATELLLQNTVFLSEIFDDRILLTGDPASERCLEYLPGLEDGDHPSIVTR